MHLDNHVVYDLLETADYLIGVRAGRTGLLSVMRRRAISTAYYAVFQAICFVLADALVDWTNDNDTRELVFRTPDHRPVKDKLTRSTDPQLRQLGAAFSALQEKRNEADYASPRHTPTHVEAVTMLQQAREAIELVEALTTAQRTLLVVALITRPRP